MRRWSASIVVGALAFGVLLLPIEPSAAAPVPPTVTGPVTGGSRTGGPWGASPTDLAPYGYIEEEYFLSGTASNRGYTSNGVPNVHPDPTAETTAPYEVRLLVRRPADPAAFNGTVVLEWANVSNQADFEMTWGESHTYLMERGYVSATVSAQKAGVDQPPAGMRSWDPVRYDSLHHPGDDFSYDIFAQAGAALRSPGPSSADPMGGLRPDRIIATGASQSCFRLINYVNLFAEADAVFDGYNPTVCMTTSHPIRTDLVPILWVNTEVELVNQEDGGLLRTWEVAGASHLGWYAFRWGFTAAFRDLTSGPLGLDPTVAAGALGPLVPEELGHTIAGLGPWDESSAGAFGERGESGVCTNRFPVRFAYNMALDHLVRWIEEGTTPPVPDRFPRTQLPTRPDRDADLNAIGGLRLPPIDEPVATYVGDTPCALLGSTIAFDPVRLREAYPAHQDYVCAMDAAATAAELAGYLLADDAAELRERAVMATLWGDDPAYLASCASTAPSPPRPSAPAPERTADATLPATGGAPPGWPAAVLLALVVARSLVRAWLHASCAGIVMPDPSPRRSHSG